MEVTIDLDDYVTKAQIQEIAEEEMRYALRRQINREEDMLRILSQLTDDYIFNMMSEEWDCDLKTYLKEKICESLSDPLYVRLYMFQNKDYNSPEGPAWPILREECEKARPLIAEAVRKNMDGYEIKKMSEEEVCETIAEVIAEKLFAKEE